MERHWGGEFDHLLVHICCLPGSSQTCLSKTAPWMWLLEISRYMCNTTKCIPCPHLHSVSHPNAYAGYSVHICRWGVQFGHYADVMCIVRKGIHSYYDALIQFQSMPPFSLVTLLIHTHHPFPPLSLHIPTFSSTQPFHTTREVGGYGHR
jgi:hypothetical protein